MQLLSLSRKTAVLRTILFLTTLPIVFWLATSAVIPTADYSHAETSTPQNDSLQWRHTVDGWEPIDELQAETPVAASQPPIHPLTLLPLVVAVALSALLAFEPQAEAVADETNVDAADQPAARSQAVESINA